MIASTVVYQAGSQCCFTGLGTQINEKKLRKNLINLDLGGQNLYQICVQII